MGISRRRPLMLDRIVLPIQQELEAARRVLSVEPFTGIEVVDAIVRYGAQNSGKLVRPTLFLLAAKMAGARGTELSSIAAAVEMVHTASLMHDDVVDDAVLRRGLPAVRAKWGNQVSVLVGDLMWCAASKILVKHGDNRLLVAMTDAIQKITEGELLEVAHQNDSSTSLDIYLKIIEGKTSALFAAAARSGAIVAGFSGSIEETLARYGRSIGMAFQLVDDALDYFSDESQFGKKAGTDLREGKLTYPLIVARAKATPAEISIIKEALIASQAGSQSFEAVRGIIKKYNGAEEAITLARDFISEAKDALVSFKSSIERDALFTLADYVVERDA